MSAEQALWQAVIAQAMSDATLEIFTETSAIIKRLAKNDAGLSGEALAKKRAARAEQRANMVRTLTATQEAARSWLLQGGKDFARVCDYAGLDPAGVRKRAVAMAAGGWAPHHIHRMAA